MLYANLLSAPEIARFDTAHLVPLKSLTIPIAQSTFSMAIGPDKNLYAFIYNGGNPVVQVYLVHDIIVSSTSISLTVDETTKLLASEQGLGPNSLSAASSNPAVATVTLVSPGTYQVTGQSSGSCSVTISDKSENYVDVSVNVK